ncbi:branched-chain amino acid ABC transporter permease [Fusobacterium perfoetens]|uniref:branched-chain amino acid ABC transporter permease n=1 Tax=Fusobacterium perfoetens TaxID=852 RepID=UPI000482272B|nr:branched-chain amino acid ABC transporter permease [Fusobacterium perfoetens]MCI6153353.1 branched-chain amino acid ABC transporter permease [Fusobacterium perfoetens]MDY3237140.1 branched-chain amino acid ABC transporter permease [Fusobacterium perfoetens]
MDLSTLVQHIINGISLGSLYALIAIGYTMVYGILLLINFAHGDIFMMAGYFMIFSVINFGLPFFIAIPLVLILTVLLGIILERTAYRPLRNAPRMSIMISAIGASYFLENLATYLFTGVPKRYPEITWLTKIVTFGDVSFQVVTIITPIVTMILLFGLMTLVNKTKVGMAMRAASKDYEAARLMGIKINWIIGITFVIGSFLAAIGSILWGSKYPSVYPLVGMMPGLKCFIAAVFGGIGNIPGAVLGGLTLGLGEALLVAFIPSMTGYRDAFAFILLIIILIVKPNGLLGEKVTDKV